MDGSGFLCSIDRKQKEFIQSRLFSEGGKCDLGKTIYTHRSSSLNIVKV